MTAVWVEDWGSAAEAAEEAADLFPFTAFLAFSEGTAVLLAFFEELFACCCCAVEAELFRFLRLDSISPLLPLVLDDRAVTEAAGGEEGVLGVAEGVEEPVELISA